MALGRHVVGCSWGPEGFGQASVRRQMSAREWLERFKLGSLLKFANALGRRLRKDTRLRNIGALVVVENEAGSTVRTALSALFELGTRTSILGMFILGAIVE